MFEGAAIHCNTKSWILLQYKFVPAYTAQCPTTFCIVDEDFDVWSGVKVRGGNLEVFFGVLGLSNNIWEKLLLLLLIFDLGDLLFLEGESNSDVA